METTTGADRTAPPNTPAPPSIPAARRGNERTIGAALLATLALLSALPPFGTDLYLAAFPSMVTALSTTTTGVQLTLTAFLVGLGVGQLIFGPWSDRSGRMVPLLSGMALLVAASIVTIFATDIQMLTVARVLQGLGGSAGMVIGRAMILDLAHGEKASGPMNMMMAVGGIAPVVAPLVGSALAGILDWRGLLAVVAGIAVFALIATVMFVRESLPRAEREARTATRDAHAGRALVARRYVGNLIAFAFGTSVVIAYVSASPFIYQDMIGLGTLAYGLVFAVNAIGLTVSAVSAARLAGRFSLVQMTTTGLLASLVGTTVVLLLIVVGAPAWALAFPMFVAVAPIGLVIGNATTLALSAVPHESVGVASALLGVVQYVLAGIVAVLVGVSGGHTALPLALTMLGAVVIAVGGLWWGNRAVTTDARTSADAGLRTPHRPTGTDR